MAPFSSFPLHSSSLPHAPPLSTIFEPPTTTTTAAVLNIPQNPNSNSSNNNLTTDSSSAVTHKKGGKKRKCNSANTQQSKEKEKKKVQKKRRDDEEEEEGESPKGYIHVRARRGQATDSHSLAERVRRERISERMKLLQGLVPGCDKVTGKALMLDEIINYVHSLQYQVEFLSMKLASVNPMFYDFGMDLESFMLTPHHHLQELSNTTNLAALECNNILTPPNSNYNNNLLENNVFPRAQNPPHLLHQGSRQSLWEMDDNHNTTLLSSFH